MRLAQAECRRRFAAARVARLASVDVAGGAHIVPVTFALLPSGGRGADAGRDLIVFAIDHKPKTTTRLRRLDNLAAEPRVSFLVDHYDDVDWQQLWWVRADARARLPEPERDDALAALAAKYPQYQEVPLTGMVVGAVVMRWLGWSGSP